MFKTAFVNYGWHRSNMTNWILALSIHTLIGLTLSGCGERNASQELDKSKKDTQDTLIAEKIEEDSFINWINYPAIEFPYRAKFKDSVTFDTLKYEVIGTRNRYLFRIYLAGDESHPIVLKEVIGFEAYAEGDIDGDGAEEIGIIQAYPNGACRQYEIYSYKKQRWERLYSIGTHLPDRMQGVDYIRREGDTVRIIEAVPENCCQCLELDTTKVFIRRREQ